MAVLAFLALFGGLVQIPGVDDVIGKFLEPTFEDSALAADPSLDRARMARAGDRLGRSRSPASSSPTSSTSPARASTALLIERLRPLHTFLFNKWYFDEAIDVLVVRPALAIGRFANRTFERFVVDGIVTGTAGVVRGAGGVVRTAQSGFVRSYALLLVGGFAGLGLYFLVVATLMQLGRSGRRCSSDSIGLFLPRRAAGCWAVLGTLVTLAIAARPDDRLRLGGGGPAADRRRRLDPGSRRRLQPRPRRAQRLPGPADGDRLAAGHRLRRLPRAGAAPSLLPDDAARRDGDARRLPRPGPAPLRPLLRPDAGPVLLPLRRLGRRGPAIAATTKMIVYTLVGSLLMLVAAIATAILSADGGSSPSRCRAAAERPRRGQPGLALLVLRRRLPGQDARLPRSTAGCPTPTGWRRCRRSPSSPPSSPRSAPTGSCASCCRSSRTRRSSSRRSSW